MTVNYVHYLDESDKNGDAIYDCDQTETVNGPMEFSRKLINFLLEHPSAQFDESGADFCIVEKENDGSEYYMFVRNGDK